MTNKLDYSKCTLAQLHDMRKTALDLIEEIDSVVTDFFNYKIPRSTNKKVTPKYRGPNGELWSGRGTVPNWLLGQDKTIHRIGDSGLTPNEIHNGMMSLPKDPQADQLLAKERKTYE